VAHSGSVAKRFGNLSAEVTLEGKKKYFLQAKEKKSKKENQTLKKGGKK